MNKQTLYMITRLQKLGISMEDCLALRRIAMTLHRWHELECGVDNGAVERDEKTLNCFWYNSLTGKRTPTADRETGALKRLQAIMKDYPDLVPYVQGDPRGVALYILRASDIPAGRDLDSCYAHGVAVHA